MNFSTKNMANKMVKYREKLGMKPKDLSLASGLSLSQIHNLERGKGATTTIEHFQKIADALHVSLDDLFMEDLNIYHSTNVNDEIDHDLLNSFYSLKTKQKKYILKAIRSLKLLEFQRPKDTGCVEKSIYIEEIVRMIEGCSPEEQCHLRNIIREIQEISVI